MTQIMNKAKTLFLRIRFRTKQDTDKNSSSYWNSRWSMNLHEDQLDPVRRDKIVKTVRQMMKDHSCKNILEIGCGADVPLRDLKCATHLDFSLGALKRSRLETFIFADITKQIPVPDKTFDATFSSFCLMHLPDDASLERACAEISRVTKKLVVLFEGQRGGKDVEWSKYFTGLAFEELKGI